MRRSFLKIAPLAFFLTLFFFFFLRTALAQDTVVQGIVTDEEGKPLKDVKLTFEDPSRGLKFNLKTDKNGKFIKVGIPPTLYKVRAELEGYFTLESQAQIRFGYTENVEIKLQKIPPRLEDDKDLESGANSFKEGKYEEAIEYFKKVIEKFPSNYEGYFNLGLSYLKKGDLDQAIAQLEKATELNPKSVDAHFALGEAYFSKGEGEKATESFSKAIEIAPENPMAYYDLGIVYYKLERSEEALKAFDKAIELNREFSSAYYQAALCAVKIGDFQRAIGYFEEFLKVEPNAPEAAQVKVMIEELKKRIE